MWVQATLPVKLGGLVVHSAVWVTPSAFLASIKASSSLVESTCQPACTPLPLLLRMLSYRVVEGAHPPTSADTCQGKNWDQPVAVASTSFLLAQTRLLATVAKWSGAWL